MGVDAEGLAYGPDLVAEDNLESVECVVDILHDFRHGDVGGDVLGGQRPVKLLHDGCGAGRVGAHQRQRRVHKIMHRGALTQELGVGDHGEIHPRGLARLPGDDLGDPLVGAGHHRAADCHDVETLLAGKRLAYLAGHTVDV